MRARRPRRAAGPHLAARRARHRLAGPRAGQARPSRAGLASCRRCPARRTRPTRLVRVRPRYRRTSRSRSGRRASRLLADRPADRRRPGRSSLPGRSRRSSRLGRRRRPSRSSRQGRKSRPRCRLRRGCRPRQGPRSRLGPSSLRGRSFRRSSRQDRRRRPRRSDGRPARIPSGSRPSGPTSRSSPSRLSGTRQDLSGSPGLPTAHSRRARGPISATSPGRQSRWRGASRWRQRPSSCWGWAA